MLRTVSCAAAAMPRRPKPVASRMQVARRATAPNTRRPLRCASVAGRDDGDGRLRTHCRPIHTYPTAGPSRPRNIPRYPSLQIAI